MCSRGAWPSGSCARAIHLAVGVEVILQVLVLGQQVEVAPDRLLDVVLQHGDDQLVLAVEIRIERAARETGSRRDRFDTGGIDALFLEDAGGRLEQFVAGIVPGRSGSDS